MELVEAFVAERDWEPFHDAKNLSASIAIEAAELMEHFQWLRSEELAAVADDDAKMAEIREEEEGDGYDYTQPQRKRAAAFIVATPGATQRATQQLTQGSALTTPI